MKITLKNNRSVWEKGKCAYVFCKNRAKIKDGKAIWLLAIKKTGVIDTGHKILKNFYCDLL